jgi:hypothetical protein
MEHFASIKDTAIGQQMLVAATTRLPMNRTKSMKKKVTGPKQKQGVKECTTIDTDSMNG